MHKTVIVYWFSFVFSLVLSVTSLYIPHMTSSAGASRQSIPYSRLRQVFTDMDEVPWSKRSGAYRTFTKLMSRHALRHRNEQAFVDKMFHLFDIDSDNVINKMEFKTVLQLLGIVSHNF